MILIYYSNLIYYSKKNLKILANDICQRFLQDFLQAVVGPQLLSMQEQVARWNTMYIRHLLKSIQSESLIKTVISFLLGVNSFFFNLILVHLFFIHSFFLFIHF